jgi:hypothetical protein
MSLNLLVLKGNEIEITEYLNNLTLISADFGPPENA